MGIESLEIRLSGGASNVDPLASYGGALSTVSGGLVLSQALSGTVSIPGVTLVQGGGNQVGIAGSLLYNNVTKSLSWLEPGATFYGTPVSVNANGTYVIRGNGSSAGYVIVTVVSASLSSVTSYTSAVTATNSTDKIFDDVAKDVAYAGQTDYRCIYLKNTGATTMVSVQATLISDTPGVDTLTIGKVAAAVNTAETAPADRYTAPAGVSFNSVNVPVTIGDIPSGQYWGFWIKRVVAPGTVDGYAADAFRIKLNALV